MSLPLRGALLGAWAPVTCALARSIGVIVGIPDFTQDPNTAPVAFADHDARLFQQKIAAGFDVRIVVGKGEGLFAAQSALNRGLLMAKKGDSVYLFLSTRGIARPGALDGYFGAADFVSQKESSSGIRISYLQQLIENSNADRVIIFADLCREPAQLVPDNRINIRLSELSGNVPGKQVGGILATGPRQFSTEEPNLSAGSDVGFGIFGYYLANSGTQAAGAAGLKQLLGELVKGIPDKWLKSQRPRPFGNADALTVRLWSVGSPVLPLFRRGPAPRYSALLASADWEPAFLWQQDQAVEARLVELNELLNRPAPIPDPRAFAESIRDLQPRAAPEAWEALRTKAVASLAGSGQVCVSRYGIQDLLPDDPLRVSDSDFLRCAAAFTAALSLTPVGSPWEPYREMLRVRELFCRARSNVANSLDLLRQAGAIARFKIPEVDNALGIYWLESRQPERYAQAETFFKRAKEAAPGWLYPRHNLALTYAEQGDMRSAEREYRETVAMPSPQPYVYYNYGLILQRLNRPGDARRQFALSLKAYDSAIATLRSRAAEWRTTYPNEAALSLQRAKLFETARAEVHNAWGALLEGKRDLEGARQQYREALRLDGSLCPAAANLARIDLDRDDPRSVVDALGDRLRTCPDFTPARLSLAEAYRQLGLADEARAQYDEALRRQPENVAALFGIAALEDARNRREDALAWFEKAFSALRTAAAPGNSTAPSQALYVAFAERSRAAGRSDSCLQAYRLAAAGSNATLGYGELRKRARLCRVQ